MSKFVDTINARLRKIEEASKFRSLGSMFGPDDSDESFKDIYSPNYDRQVAEDALYHTIGPLTDNPRWSAEWTSSGAPPKSFTPNGPAPKWTQDEVTMAYAGDLAYLDSRKMSPKSPKHGRMGGSPLYRLAKQVSKKYGRNDPDFLMDTFNNGLLQLTMLMQPGYDQARSPFISFATPRIKGAVEHGASGKSTEAIKAYGGEAEKTVEVTDPTGKVSKVKEKTGIKGLGAVLNIKNPKELRRIANQVQGRYQTEKSYDKVPENPFGQYSSRFYKTVMDYADAIESGDKAAIESALNNVAQLRDTIKDEMTVIRGASTGAGEAISTGSRKSVAYYTWNAAKKEWLKDKAGSPDPDPGWPDGYYDGEKKKIQLTKKVESIDSGETDVRKYKEPEETVGSAMAGEGEFTPEGSETQETIYYILKIALEYDIGSILKGSPLLAQKATEMGVTKVGGKLTANEYRYALRSLGVWASRYPGQGVLRSNLNIPRDASNWWRPGEDPEIEPIPSGGIWESIWSRTGHNEMSVSAITEEMTKEVEEFAKLNIKTARQIGVNRFEPGKAKTTKTVISSAAVSAAMKSALAKIKIIAAVHKSDVGVEEGLATAYLPILESLDHIDKNMIYKSCSTIISKLNRSIAECEQKHNKLFDISNNEYVTAIISLPTSAIAEALNDKYECFVEHKCCAGRSIKAKFNSRFIPSLNLMTKIVCDQNGYSDKDYSVHIENIEIERDSPMFEGYVELHNVINDHDPAPVGYTKALQRVTFTVS